MDKSDKSYGDYTNWHQTPLQRCGMFRNEAWPEIFDEHKI